MQHNLIYDNKKAGFTRMGFATKTKGWLGWSVAKRNNIPIIPSLYRKPIPTRASALDVVKWYDIPGKREPASSSNPRSIPDCHRPRDFETYRKTVLALFWNAK